MDIPEVMRWGLKGLFWVCLLFGFGLSVFGIVQLGSATLSLVQLVPTNGRVVDYETETAMRGGGEVGPGGRRTVAQKVTIFFPIVEYMWPTEGGTRYRYRSPTGSHRLPDSLAIGAELKVRLDPNDPERASLKNPLHVLGWGLLNIVFGTALLALAIFFWGSPDLLLMGPREDVVFPIWEHPWSFAWLNRLGMLSLVLVLLAAAGLMALDDYLGKGASQDLLGRDWDSLVVKLDAHAPGELLGKGDRLASQIPLLRDRNPTVRFMSAVRSGDTERAGRYLAARASSEHSFDFELGDAVTRAAYGAHPDLVALLLDNGGDPDAPLEWPPIVAAMDGGCAACVRLLVAGGADVNVRPNGMTPIELAIGNGNVDAALALLEADDIDLEAKDRKGRTAADLAVLGCHVELVHGLNRRGLQSSFPKLEAIVLGDLAAVQALLSGKRVATEEGVGLLQHAARAGRVDVVRELLDMGLDVNHQMKHRHFAIHDAVQTEHEEIVRILTGVEGFQADVTDVAGDTPLQMAIRGRMFAIARILVQVGADPNRRSGDDGEGSTPMHLAAMSGDIEFVKFMLAHGGSPDARDYKKRRPREVAEGPEIYELLSEVNGD